MKETKVVPPDCAKKRLDEFLSESWKVSRSAGKKWIEAGGVLINGALVKRAGLTVKPGMKIDIDVAEPKVSEPQTELPPAEIIAEEKEFLVVRKPAGIVTHPDTAHRNDSLVQRVLKRHSLASIGFPDRPGVVHRLDKDTSGLLLLAKTDAAYHALQRIFAERKIVKKYLAVVHGTRLPTNGTIESPIMRDSQERKKMTVSASEKARNALSHFEVIGTGSETSLLRVNIETGRTHQIRVHLSAIDFPVVGDITYGNGKLDRELAKKYGTIPRLMLHAQSLLFEFNGEQKYFQADPPEDFKDFLERTGVH